MSRCILVLGAPRSGTSAVAGALHRMGVDMGEGHLQPADDLNPAGYFEDLRWQKENRRILGQRYAHGEVVAIDGQQELHFEQMATAFEAEKRLWGMKDQRLCFTAQFIWPHLTDPRLVVVQREAGAAAASLQAHSARAYKGAHLMSLEGAAMMQADFRAALKRRLSEFRGPVAFVRYERLLADPDREMARLAAFVYERLELWPNLKAAVQFIDRGLQHHG